MNGQQQQQTNLKPIAPKKVGGKVSNIVKNAKRFDKVSKSVKKTMGY